MLLVILFVSLHILYGYMHISSSYLNQCFITIDEKCIAFECSEVTMDCVDPNEILKALIDIMDKYVTLSSLRLLHWFFMKGHELKDKEFHRKFGNQKQTKIISPIQINEKK